MRQYSGLYSTIVTHASQKRETEKTKRAAKGSSHAQLWFAMASRTPAWTAWEALSGKLL